jgi:hypothetical protein
MGELLVAGRLQDAWNTLTAATGSCWDSLGKMIKTVLPAQG